MMSDMIRNCFEPNAEIDIDDPEGFLVEGQILSKISNIPVDEWL